ncbi:OmpA family protein [Endomicrobium proavitum]|uniref:OmpA family protein n=1 Tax=Endomicrobium proavitum TaxID=1408281 RepID=A0A0G3WI02_9BACT|nr:OmpA family protein [Endomicrobium proavitum]AKL97487.1 OmpA family protein [Endomicrobium proavitum]
MKKIITRLNGFIFALALICALLTVVCKLSFAGIAEKAQESKLQSVKIAQLSSGKPHIKPFNAGLMHFDTRKYNISPQTQAELKILVKEINQFEYDEIIVEGHTDFEGSGSGNIELSKNRAKAVYGELLKLGVPPAKIKYYGSSSYKPKAENYTTQGKAANRRVEIFVK